MVRRIRLQILKHNSKSRQIPKTNSTNKKNTRKKLQTKFNSVLINYYKNNLDYMGKHSDNEPELGINPTIASLTLGEKRIFKITHNITKQTYKLEPQNGSLIIMKNDSQKLYKHEITKTTKTKGERINLTFRYIHE